MNATPAAELEQLNSIAPLAWTREGWRLLEEWRRNGDPKHLDAFNRHISGIRARLERSQAPTPR